MTFTSPVVNHARIVRTAAGRTWCGGPGRRVTVENRTACGADPSSYDVRVRQSDGKVSKAAASFLRCSSCRASLGLSRAEG